MIQPTSYQTTELGLYFIVFFLPMIFFVCSRLNRESKVFEAFPLVKALQSHHACDSSEFHLLHITTINDTFFKVIFLPLAAQKEWRLLLKDFAMFMDATLRKRESSGKNDSFMGSTP